MVRIIECIDCKRRIGYARADEKVKLDFDLCDDCYNQRRKNNKKRLVEDFYVKEEADKKEG